MVPRRVENVKVNLSHTLQNSTAQGCWGALVGKCFQPEGTDPVRCLLTSTQVLYHMCAAQCTLTHSEEDIQSNSILSYALDVWNYLERIQGQHYITVSRLWFLEWDNKCTTNNSKTGQVESVRGTGGGTVEETRAWVRQLPVTYLTVTQSTERVPAAAQQNNLISNMGISPKTAEMHTKRLSIFLVFKKMQTKSTVGAGGGADGGTPSVPAQESG